MEQRKRTDLFKNNREQTNYKMKLGIINVCFLLAFISSYEQEVRRDTSSYLSKPFVHFGMAQTKADMDYMKAKVEKGEEPWKSAFERLEAQTDLAFKPEPRTHISVGAYGANSTGGREFSQSSEAAYRHALMWYITDDKRYANKAIEILRAWSSVLWDFDDNNAKLNVGLDAPGFLYAAEILKHTASGWKKVDVKQFECMVMTVFYPVIKDFFTEANGNWDASMIHTMLCIGVLVDNHEIFNRAVERFFHGPGNSGISKYIYPNGQIQETTRDWGHVQLGIGEFAKAAQVAWTQGVDFYSAADNRLALGFEYTAKFLLGGHIPVYGVLSTRERDKFRDIYESVYNHYHVMGIDLPYTEKLIQQHTRKTSSVMVLTGIRKPIDNKIRPAVQLTLTAQIPATTSLSGAKEKSTQKPPVDAIYVKPENDLQAALDQYASTGKWIVLDTGVYVLAAPLRMPSGTILAGQGKRTVLFLSPKVQGKTIVNGTATMHDVIIRDLLIEGAINVRSNSDPNSERRTRSYMNAPSRAGISFQADSIGQMRNITIEHVTVQNFTKNGVTIRGARNVQVADCDFSDNGSSVVPGAGFHHNLDLTRIIGGQVINSRLDTSPWGNGLALSFAENFLIAHNETARNRLSGIHCTESRAIRIVGNLSEGNDVDGISLPALYDGNSGITLDTNTLQYNGRNGIFIEKFTDSKLVDNKQAGNGYIADKLPDFNTR